MQGSITIDVSGIRFLTHSSANSGSSSLLDSLLVPFKDTPRAAVLLLAEWFEAFSRAHSN